MSIEISGDSFLYNDVDMYKTFGIMCIAHRSFTANLRPRKVVVPTKSGAYDYGANYHDERELQLECEVTRSLLKNEEIDEFDDLKYLLCGGKSKGKIILWDQPDRYYYGRVYDQDVVRDYFNLSGRQITLRFICDPYAYGLEAKIFKTTENNLDLIGENKYIGTRQTPTRITIRNTGSAPINGIQITTYTRRS